MANNLAKIRGKHQMTQKDLAEKLEISTQGLCFSEKGKVSVKVAEKTAEILNENVFDILGSDALVLLPKNKQDKDILIKMIKEL